jgi:hypothetical protein
MTNGTDIHIHHNISYYFVAQYAYNKQEAYTDRLYSICLMILLMEM